MKQDGNAKSSTYIFCSKHFYVEELFFDCRVQKQCQHILNHINIIYYITNIITINCIQISISDQRGLLSQAANGSVPLISRPWATASQRARPCRPCRSRRPWRRCWRIWRTGPGPVRPYWGMRGRKKLPRIYGFLRIFWAIAGGWGLGGGIGSWMLCPTDCCACSGF